MKLLLTALLTIFGVWTLYSLVPLWNIEKPSYTVLEKKRGYEIRKYDSYIVASTTVGGSYGSGLNSGFMTVANYIFGNNTTNTKVAMTSPVIEESSQKIAMTTPVIESTSTENGSSTRTVSFVMPSKFTMETLPTPNNNNVTLTEVPEHIVAVKRFGWYATPERTNSKKEQLLKEVTRDGFEITGNIQAAYYNQPASMPLTLRNEVMVPIDFDA